MTGGRLHVLVHSLDAKNNKLPNRLEVSAVYTDLKRGSKSVPVILRNMTVFGHHPEQRRQSHMGPKLVTKCQKPISIPAL